MAVVFLHYERNGIDILATWRSRHENLRDFRVQSVRGEVRMGRLRAPKSVPGRTAARDCRLAHALHAQAYETRRCTNFSCTLVQRAGSNSSYVWQALCAISLRASCPNNVVLVDSSTQCTLLILLARLLRSLDMFVSLVVLTRQYSRHRSHAEVCRLSPACHQTQSPLSC